MKKPSTIVWVVGGVAALAASAYAAKRLQTYLAWREEKDLEETKREIDRYEAYVHANGGKKKKPRATKKTQVTS
jgi:hypothetical protein